MAPGVGSGRASWIGGSSGIQRETGCIEQGRVVSLGLLERSQLVRRDVPGVDKVVTESSVCEYFGFLKKRSFQLIATVGSDRLISPIQHKNVDGDSKPWTLTLRVRWRIGSRDISNCVCNSLS
jgi:hypothetical protein